MKLKIVILLSGLLTILGKHAATQASERLYVGLRQFSETRLILLGVPPEEGREGFNFTHLGFQGEGLDQIDPKFLLEVNPQGIIRVRSFELKNRTKSIVGNSGNSPGLPPLLIDTSNAKSKEWQHLAGNALVASAKSLGFPIATAAIIGRLREKQSENLKKLNAFYLIELIYQTILNHRFAPLRDAISPHPSDSERFLKKLGAALLIRYNPVSNRSGAIFTNDPEGSEFETWLTQQSAVRSGNREIFLRRMNQFNLPVHSYGNEFAIVSVDLTPGAPVCSTPTYLSKMIQLGPENLGPREAAEALRVMHLLETPEEPLREKLAPWYLVSFTHPKGPLDLVNFAYPGLLGKRMKSIATSELQIELGSSIIPILPYWISKAARWCVKKSSYKQEKTHYLSRLQSYGSLLALLETQVFRPTANTLSLALAEERSGHLLKALSADLKQHEKNIHFFRLKSYLNNARVSRQPAAIRIEPFPERNPVILFLVDGMRPDRFRLAIKEGLMPHLKKLFSERGTEMESFTSRSLTLPSWSTILTGFEPDMHGIRSNTPTSRLERKFTTSYLDAKPDIGAIAQGLKNRAFKRLEEDKTGEAQRVWVPSYFHRSQTILNFMPISSEARFPVKDALHDFFENLNQYLAGIRYLPSVYDISSAKTTARVIREDIHQGGHLRLVMNWYTSIDEASHSNNASLPIMYKNIDQAVGMVLDAALEHPSLKKATVFLISDHGHSAGYGPFDEDNKIFNTKQNYLRTNEGPLLLNTGFHLPRFLAGDYFGYEKYHLIVGTADAVEPKFNPGWFFSKKYHTYPQSKGGINVLVDSSGNNLAQVYLKGDPNWRRSNFYELSHFIQKNGSKEILDIPADLLSVQQRNLMTDDPELGRWLTLKTERHPVKIFAMPLAGDLAQQTADRLGATAQTTRSTREPVLVLAHGKNGEKFRAGLILTRSDLQGNDHFRYIVLKHFNQDPSGQILAEVSTQPEDDPLEYLGQVKDAHLFHQWREDREWLALAQNHVMPTAIFSLVRTLTLAPKFTQPTFNLVPVKSQRNRQGEIPDFILIANPGFAFHSADTYESDHGGLLREEVRNTFFISSLDSSRFNRPKKLEDPSLTRDIMPTVLDFAGLGNSLPKTQGRSIKSRIED